MSQPAVNIHTEEVWLTVKEAAQYASIKTDTIYQLIKRNHIDINKTDLRHTYISLTSLASRYPKSIEAYNSQKKCEENKSKLKSIPKSVDTFIYHEEAGRRYQLLQAWAALSNHDRIGAKGDQLRSQWADAPDVLIEHCRSIGEKPHPSTLNRLLKKIYKLASEGRDIEAPLITLGRLSPRIKHQKEILTDEQRALAVKLFWGDDYARPEYISSAYEAWLENAQARGWKPISYSTFRRVIQKAPKDSEFIARHGFSAYKLKCSPYITRNWEDVLPNDFWVGDHHILDLFVRDESTGKLYRPHLTGWLDGRSRVLIGWIISKQGNSHTIKEALVHGIMPKQRPEYTSICGLPKGIYTDNGKDYRCYDIEGKLKRFRKETLTEKDAASLIAICPTLKIFMIRAIVKNARAKIIERYFRTAAHKFSSCMPGYCGNNKDTKPEEFLKKQIIQHEKWLRKESCNGKPIESPFLTLAELKVLFEKWLLKHYHLKNHRGLTHQGRKFTPLDTFKYLAQPANIPDKKSLIFFLMRKFDSIKQTNGVWIEGLWYRSDALLKLENGTLVRCRRDPEDIGRIYVFDSKTPQFICEAINPPAVRAMATEEELRAAIREQRAHRKRVKEGIKTFTSAAPPDLISVFEHLSSGVAPLSEETFKPADAIRRVIPQLDRIQTKQVEPPPDMTKDNLMVDEFVPIEPIKMPKLKGIFDFEDEDNQAAYQGVRGDNL